MQSTCFNCFHTKPSEQACPYCGYDHAGNEEKYPLALKAGVVLANRYYLGRVLGQGGFGVTYIALDSNTRSRVAIKEYLPMELAIRDQNTSALQIYSANVQNNYEYGKQQFLDEVKTLSQFQGNEHIISILSYFEENNTAYFAMEYMEGVNLKQYMEKLGRTLEVYEANQILLPVVESLDWVHSKGVIHRDISPDNIMIRSDGTAKLIDFGAARYSTGEVSRSLDVILKHGFAPREQYTRHGRQGPYTDVYSMAATYYYAITGKVPPDAINRTEQDELILPSSLGIHIRKSTENVLLKALAVSYSERWQTMQEFYSAMIQSMPSPFAPDKESVKGNTISDGLDGVTEKETREKTAARSAAPAAGRISNTDRFAAKKPTGGTQKKRVPPEESVSSNPAIAEQSGKKKGQGKLIAIIAAALMLVGVFAFVFIRPPANSSVSATSLGTDSKESSSQDTGTETVQTEQEALPDKDAGIPSMLLDRAASGNTDAMRDIGIMYYQGDGVPQDYKKAMEWYQKAAELGNSDAVRWIGVLYGNGSGVPQDKEKEMEWYLKAADLGNTYAMRIIATLYHNAWHDKKSVEWIQKALDLGDFEAMNDLALHYEYGWGVPQDDEKAVELYLKAADLGSTTAMRTLGSLYEYGGALGVTKDTEKAREWYEKALEKGDTWAQQGLDRLQDSEEN